MNWPATSHRHLSHRSLRPHGIYFYHTTKFTKTKVHWLLENRDVLPLQWRTYAHYLPTLRRGESEWDFQQHALKLLNMKATWLRWHRRWWRLRYETIASKMCTATSHTHDYMGKLNQYSRRRHPIEYQHINKYMWYADNAFQNSTRRLVYRKGGGGGGGVVCLSCMVDWCIDLWRQI